MAFWIFKCSPAKYRLSERLADPNPRIRWRVTRYRDEIRPGDTVFIWETGPARGIRAIMRVDEPPHETMELPSEQPYNTRPITETARRITGTLLDRHLNLPQALLREVAGLEQLSVLRKDVFQQATNFPVTDAEGEILLRLAGEQGSHPTGH